MSKNKIGEDSKIPKLIYLKIGRRDGVETLTTLEEDEFKVPIDGCIKGACLFMIFCKIAIHELLYFFLFQVDLVSVGAFLKSSDTWWSSHHFFPQKLYFVNLYHIYDISHLSKIGLVFKVMDI